MMILALNNLEQLSKIVCERDRKLIVETAEQFEYLVNTNCNIIQGYYFRKPILPDEIEKQWLSK